MHFPCVEPTSSVTTSKKLPLLFHRLAISCLASVLASDMESSKTSPQATSGMQIVDTRFVIVGKMCARESSKGSAVGGRRKHDCTFHFS